MTSPLNVLLGTMDKLVQVHRRILNLAQRQKQALISGDNTQLQAVIDKMNTEVEKLATLESERMLQVSALIETASLHSGTWTVSELAAHFGGSKGNELLRVAETLKSVLAELNQVNVQNAELTSQSLTYNMRMMQWMTECSKPVGYGKTGRTDDVSGPRFISLQA